MGPSRRPQRDALLGRRLVALERRLRWTPPLVCLAVIGGLLMGLAFELRGAAAVVIANSADRPPAARSVLDYHGLAVSVAVAPAGPGTGQTGVSGVGLGWLNFCRPAPGAATTSSRSLE
jgi:hypothetical protein